MANDAKPTRPSGTTKQAEEADAQVHAAPDDMPTPDEDAAAERADEIDSDVEKSYGDAIERGAHQQGEGRLP